MVNTRRKMTAWLPGTICHPEFRDEVVAVARAQNKSLSELQREALSLFLESAGSKHTVDDSSNTTNKEEQAS